MVPLDMFAASPQMFFYALLIAAQGTDLTLFKVEMLVHWTEQGPRLHLTP